MNSKQQMVDLLNQLTDVANSLHTGSSTVLSGYIHSLRQAIHQSSAREVDDPYAVRVTDSRDLRMPAVVEEQVRNAVHDLNERAHASGFLPPDLHLMWVPQ